MTESLTQMSLANRKCFDEKYLKKMNVHIAVDVLINSIQILEVREKKV